MKQLGLNASWVSAVESVYWYVGKDGLLIVLHMERAYEH